MEKLPQITNAKQVGQNLNVTIGDETLTVKGNKEFLAPVKEAVKLYQEKGTKTNLTKLMKLLKPATTKKVEEKEKETAAVKAEIKKEKNVSKKAPKVAAKSKKAKVNLVKELESQIADKDVTEEDLEAMRRLLAKGEAIVKSKPVAAPIRGGRREF